LLNQVVIDGVIVGKIDRGLLVLLGIERDDTRYEAYFARLIVLIRESMQKLINKNLKVPCFNSHRSVTNIVENVAG